VGAADLIQATTGQPGSKIALVALHAGYSHSSLALKSLAAHCRDQPFYPSIHCFETLVNISHQRLLEQLLALEPRVVGFSTYLWNIDATLGLAARLRRLLPECRIVLGGPEAGPRGEELLGDHPELDYVVDGEGEAAWRDLLRLLLLRQGKPGRISGLIWRGPSRPVRNPQTLLPAEALPAPIALGLMDLDKPLVYWETSRGCPYRCSFCGSADEQLRAFPLERIEADLRVLEGLQDKVVKLLDRSFHLGRERTVRLLERFAATPVGLRFHLELNPDRISPEAMAVFRQAPPGKFQFEIDLQSLNQPVLDAINRRMDIPKALANIRELVAMARHPVHLDLIVGLPGEDEAHCRDSLDRVFRLHPGHLQLGTLKLLPGTPLRAQAQQLGYRWDPRPPYEVLSHPLLGFQQIARFKRYAVLLERLWNSGYLVATLSRLVPACYQDRVSACWDDLLATQGEGIVWDKLQPDTLYERVCDFLQPWLARDALLGQLLLWDYSQFSLVTRKTPPWIAAGLCHQKTLVVDGSRRRLPLLSLSEAAVALINRRRITPLEAGRYAVWPRQRQRGRPVRVIPVPD